MVRGEGLTLGPSDQGAAYQFYLDCLPHVSYLVSDKEIRVAVHPQRDVDRYETFVGDKNLTIKHVILTHPTDCFLARHLERHDGFGANSLPQSRTFQIEPPSFTLK